jgi:hypothetical protein
VCGEPRSQGRLARSKTRGPLASPSTLGTGSRVRRSCLAASSPLIVVERPTTAPKASGGAEGIAKRVGAARALGRGSQTAFKGQDRDGEGPEVSPVPDHDAGPRAAHLQHQHSGGTAAAAAAARWAVLVDVALNGRGTRETIRTRHP